MSLTSKTDLPLDALEISEVTKVYPSAQELGSSEIFLNKLEFDKAREWTSNLSINMKRLRDEKFPGATIIAYEESPIRIAGDKTKESFKQRTTIAHFYKI